MNRHPVTKRADLSTRRWRCTCGPAEATAWLDDLAAMALADTELALGRLCAAVDHYLAIERRSRARGRLA